ncbi:L-threonylcarbamoyladenylate synthase [Patescibacteria group bacterium]|nr:L-threonylcarbamoyladenylate synthase [Patescibacteria group bacterium]
MLRKRKKSPKRLKISTSRFSKEIKLIKDGKVGILPTDTLYGLVGSCFSKEAVKEIYRLKRRNSKKPFIILISSLDDLKLFNIKISVEERELLEKIWPGPVSTALKINAPGYQYLTRGGKTLAFRLPKPLWLRNFISQSGPLVAPTANFEGESPSKSISDARAYFDDEVSFYINKGRLTSKPSTLISLENGRVKVIREGAFDVRGLINKENNGKF